MSHNIGSTLFFAIFLSSTLPKYKKQGEYKKIQEICYQIGTRILKIDLQIAEIIDVKDVTCHLEIDILLLLRCKKIILVLEVATLTSIISANSKSILKFLVSIL